ncbi:MAG: hypothetical protein UF305_01270 [Oscillospiraceae bacterium]|nr:hypothetical protein [Oscillospiraceae bacterium]
MEIKTIIRPLTLRSYSTQFDAEVNAALKEGWELTEVRPLHDGAELCAILTREAAPESPQKPSPIEAMWVVQAHCQTQEVCKACKLHQFCHWSPPPYWQLPKEVEA